MRRARVLPIAVLCAGMAGAAVAGPPQPAVRSTPTPASDWTRCVPGMAGVPTERVRLVAPRSPERTAIEPVIRGLFPAQEQALRLSSPNLADAPVTVVAVHASTGTRPTEYYFEASKAVRDEATEVPGEEGLLRIVVTGWLRARGTAFASVGTKGDMMWVELDHPGATDVTAELLPLGILRRGGVVVWALKRATPAGGLRFYEIGPTSVQRREAARVPGC